MPDAESDASYPLEGWIAMKAADHQPDRKRGGCTCGFAVWYGEHVAVMGLPGSGGRGPVLPRHIARRRIVTVRNFTTRGWLTLAVIWMLTATVGTLGIWLGLGLIPVYVVWGGIALMLSASWWPWFQKPRDTPPGEHDHEKCCRYLRCAHPMCCGYYGRTTPPPSPSTTEGEL